MATVSVKNFDEKAPFELEHIEVANPPSSTQMTPFLVPSNEVWQLLGCNANLTTSANVGNRRPMLLVTQSAAFGGIEYLRSYSPNTIPASSGNNTWWGNGLIVESTTWGTKVAMLPFLILPTRYIGIKIDGLLSGDTITNLSFVFKKWTL